MNRAVTSASNVHRRAVCPGSERLEADLPEEDSVQSREGTLLHAYDANPALERAVLKPDQRDLLTRSSDLEAEVFRRVTEQFAIAIDEPYTQGVETALMVHRGIKALIPGHCDKWRHYHKRGILVILDKKFGYIEVTPAAANYQLRTYAVAGAEQWKPVNDVVVAITQPRLPYEQRITMAAYTADDIKAAKQELFAIKDACTAPDAPLRPTEDGCRYCKAKLICPAFRAAVQDGMAIVALPDREITVAAREEHIARVVAALPDEKLDDLLVKLQMAQFIAEPARDEARRRVASGALPGWKLGKASEMRKVADPERAIALLTMDGTFTREEVLRCSDPKLKALETTLREKTGGTWKDARETIDNRLAPVLELTEKKPSLVRVK